MSYEMNEEDHTLCICKECNHEEWIQDEEIFEAYGEGYVDEEYNIILICPQCGGEMVIEEED